MTKHYIPPKLTDDEIAKVINEACKLVDDDAKPVLIFHLYEMAYKLNENGNSALFASGVGELIGAIANA